jgi:GT2 family glycosyltransferase
MVDVAQSKLPLRLTAASWLSDSTMLLVGSHDPGSEPITSIHHVRGDSSTELRVRYLAHPASMRSATESAIKWLAVAQGHSSLRGSSNFGLAMSTAVETCQVDPSSFALALTDLRTLVREELTALDPHQRGVIVEFLAASATEADQDDGANRLRLSRNLNLAREMLRERLPICDLRPNRIEAVVVETVMALDELSFYVEGWMCDGESSAVRMTAVSPEGARTELLGNVFRYRRPDAEEFFRAAIGEQRDARYGFICNFHVSAPSLLPNGWLVEVETAAGTAMEAVAPTVITEYQRIRTELLNDLAHDVNVSRELRRGHISPALSAVQARRNRRIRVDATREFGEQPTKPVVSIIVPLYARIDLVEHQMAQFADDPELRDAELIYVLDSPELKSDLLTMAEGLFQLYRLPFKVLVLSENAGFSTANNIAATYAHGRLLLLLNSDVLPREAGWLSELTAFYEALEKPGALGPKLIYEDSSLQHAGLYFERVPGRNVWMNEHFYKGLHSDLPAANVARQVPAVTGACLMIEAKLYADVGGLSGVYIQGDYEDSDLCMRLSATGRENWYFPRVELYHLEGQSYQTSARQVNYEYNRWLFNETWSEAIRNANSKPELVMTPAAQVIPLASGRVKGAKARQSDSLGSPNGKDQSSNPIATRAQLPTTMRFGPVNEQAE